MFFSIVAKAPNEVCAADVLGFITAQRTGGADAGAVTDPPGGPVHLTVGPTRPSRPGRIMTTTNRRLRLTQPDQMPTPVVDDLSATVLDEAIETLGEFRTPYWVGDSAVRLHALASLLLNKG